MSDPAQFIRAGTGLQAMGSLYGGFAARNQAQAQAAALDQAAVATAAEAVQAEDLQRRQARQFLSAQAVAMAQSGSAPTDTSRKLGKQSAIDAELDALAIRYQGQMRQAGLRAQAGTMRTQGGNALVGGLLGAGAQVLAGRGQLSRLKANRLLVEE